MECKNCKLCRNRDHIEMISLNKEDEQDLIKQSVEVNTTKYKMVAQLPLTHDTLSVFNPLLEKLSKSKKDIEDVVSSKKKLQHLGQYFNSVQNSVKN